MRSVVVVGASLAGIEAARVLREEGYEGRLTVVGEEPLAPYDRPPLSKGFLAATVEEADLRLPLEIDELDLRLGTRATRLLPRERAVETSDGRRLTSDAVVLATGARARPMRTPLGSGQGVHVLRTLEHASDLRSELEPGKRLVVVGGGFIGAEVAATARTMGLDVTVVEPQAQLLETQLGTAVGGVIAEAHRAHGVRVLTGLPVTGLVGDERVRAVRVAGDEEIAADVVLVGIGSEPAVDWLHGSGLACADGVLCDGQGRTSAPGVVAVGDCAAWRSVEGAHRRRQHWTAALRQAGVAARVLVGHPPSDHPAEPDYVWSDQYDLRLQVAGRPDPSLSSATVSGTLGVGPFTLAFHGPDQVVRAVASVNEPRMFGKWRRLVGTPQALLSPA